MEKNKTTLEAENQDLANDLKQVQMAKQESERKRKQAEQQLQEASIKLQELDQGRGETVEKVTKLATELDTTSQQLEQAETKAMQLTSKVSSLDTQLADAQVWHRGSDVEGYWQYTLWESSLKLVPSNLWWLLESTKWIGVRISDLVDFYIIPQGRQSFFTI